MNSTRYFLLAVTGLVSTAALAQWQWTDKDGGQVFSDRAPPADILQKNILRQPAVTTLKPEPQESAVPLKLSGVDKDLVEKKKKAEEAVLALRKIEEERVLKAKVENCARAKQAKAGFDSGIRIARSNEKGEREILDDAARALELKRIQSIIDSDCK